MLAVIFVYVVLDVLAVAQDHDMALAVVALCDPDHNLELALQAMAVAALCRE